MKYIIQELTNRNNVKLLLQLETLSHIGSVMGICLGTTSVILVFQEKTKMLALLLMIFMWLVIFFIIYLRRISNKVIVFVINELVDLNKYIAFYQTEADSLIKLYRSNYQQNLEYVKGQVSFLKGEFNKSLVQFLQIDLSKVWKRYSKGYYLTNCYYKLVSSVHLFDEQKIQKFEEQLLNASDYKNQKSTLVEKAKSIKDIVFNKQPNNYFDDHSANSRLGKITYTYYAALNARLKGEEARTRELFESIAQENPELFYVQEAKRYLEEN